MSKKRALGRGLEALLPGSGAKGSVDDLHQLPLEKIRTNPRQSRQVFDKEKLAELALSIDEVGLVQPIIVRPFEDGYELVSGERRLRAFQELGRDQIPALVREMADTEVAAAVLIENIQREDLNPVEEAQGYRRLIEEFSLTQEEVARRIGKSRVHVTNTLRLLTLPVQVQEIVSSGALSAGHARALVAVNDPVRQVELAQRAVARGLSVRALEEEVRNKPRLPENKNVSGPAASELTGLEMLLRERIGAFRDRVSIRGNRNKGRLVIHYRSEQELQEVMDWLDRLGGQRRRT